MLGGTSVFWTILDVLQWSCFVNLLFCDFLELEPEDLMSTQKVMGEGEGNVPREVPRSDKGRAPFPPPL